MERVVLRMAQRSDIQVREVIAVPTAFVLLEIQCVR
jgi:hypothetical protein